MKRDELQPAPLVGDTRNFSLGAVLSVTTDRLLTDVGNLYGILNHMTQDTLWTHQLPRACDECKPWLLRWYPDLDSPELLVEVSALELMLGTPSGRADPNHLIIGWLSGLVTKGLCRETYTVLSF